MISCQVEVAWGEMDALGHVNNTVFFKYFENARIAYFAELDPAPLGEGLLNPILASTRCDFQRPVVFPDTLTVDASVVKVGRTSFTMEYTLTSESQGEVVARGEATVVNVDPKAGKSAPIPDKVRQGISRIEGRDFS